jgi:ankyrin repeat protein
MAANTRRPSGGCTYYLIDQGYVVYMAERAPPKGANPNATDAAGATALQWAIPDPAKVKLLIGAGADVNARSTNRGRTPFLIAASYPGTVEILNLLLEKTLGLVQKLFSFLLR